MVAFSEQLPECREPLYAQPPTEAKLGDLNQNLDGKRGPESWLLFHIREGDLPVFLSVLQLGGGVLKRQEGECLFLDPRAHPGLFLPHSVLGQPCIESFLWEVSVHKLHVIPAPGGKSWGSWRPTDLGRRWENEPRSADGKTGETLRGTCLSRATTLMRRRSLV